ncbi:MAG: Hpt domain-containing protein, partial [Gammaproteobacteria bacterium]|nr:Hpt domain-containing protein [Gammaproteobacteria bacterium]
DKEYRILGDDADPEILEIFIEEALEELASINEQLPRWRENINDEEALTTIRRSFHTLKGSGRLISADLIGEFSWAFESMLNRVIDKSRPADEDVFAALDEALGILPQLIEQLTGNREPVDNVYELIARVDALGKWDKTDKAKSSVKTRPAETSQATDVSSPEPGVSSESDLDAELSLAIEEPVEESMNDLSLEGLDFSEQLDEPAETDFGDIDMSAFEVSESDLSSDLLEDDDDLLEPELSDDFDIDLTTDLESLQMAAGDSADNEPGLGIELDLTEINVEDADQSSEQIESPVTELTADNAASELMFEEDSLAIHVDPVLFEIYKDESEAHLEQMQKLLDRHYSGEQPLLAGQDLIRALHTLYGSARTAEVDAIAEICGAMEKYVRLYAELGIEHITDDGVQLIDDMHRIVSSMLEVVANPATRLHSDQELLSRIQVAIDDLAAQAPAQDVVLDFEQSIELESTPEVESAPAATAPISPAPAEVATVEETLVAYGDVDDELVDIFLEEAEELIDGCENSLQKWSSNNADADSVQELQRQLHTLKGGARMADLSTIGDLTHALESLIIAVNEKRVKFNKDMDYVLHESMDNLSDMLSKVKTREPLYTAGRLINLLDSLRRGETVDVKKNEAEIATDEVADIDLASAVEQEEEVSLLDFSEELYPDGDDVIDEPASELGDDNILGLDSFAEAAIDESDFELESGVVDEKYELEEPAVVPPPPEPVNVESKDEPIPALTAEDQPVKSNIAQEQVRVRSDLLNELVNHAGEVSVYHARMNQQITNFSFNLSEMDQTVARLREQLRKLTIETEAQILSRYEKEADQYDKDFDPLEMDRFSTMQQISRSLQETVSDMESIRDILSEDVRDAETLLLQESRVSGDLQEGLMRTRMVHFGGLASRLRRIVRQTARELDKEVELEITGESSEVDRTVLDKIIAPMEHMLRNAVSHGIEMPSVRSNAGKSEQGVIKISVDREGGDVVIKVADDGRGIDVVAVRNKAIAQGLMDRSSALSDHDVLQFIMKPGFSTAEKVTQISGRGVGMDVVDSEIKQLGGVLEIATIEGRGTTFTIRLPLTLAINHALMVSAGEEMYAIPLNAIEGVVRLSGPELQMFYDSESSKYEFAGVQYELKHLGKMLTGVQPDYSRMGQLYPVLLSHVGDQFVALHVDDLLGRREIVVKPVGPQIGHVRTISGATILGDGRVVLILDMNSLVIGDAMIQVAGEQVMPVEQVAPKIIEEHIPIVMVVDDSITIRKVTERMLGRHNMKVVTAKDGVDAVSQLQDLKPDVMLLDIEMPRMDGYEVATHVRNDSRLKDLPIIMITSRSGTKHKDKAMEIGVNKYLGKPYQEDELMANIHELIG